MKFQSLYHAPTSRQLLLLDATMSALVLAVALVAQYGFYLAPCELCMAQRYPYIAIIIIGLLGAYAAKSPRARHGVIALCALLFVVDGGIATYHAGVEAGIFPAPSACASNTTGGQTLEEMRRAIMNAPLVTCDQAMLHVLGLSMAAWNAIAAFAMAAITLIQWRKVAR